MGGGGVGITTQAKGNRRERARRGEPGGPVDAGGGRRFPETRTDGASRSIGKQFNR